MGPKKQASIQAAVPLEADECDGAGIILLGLVDGDCLLSFFWLDFDSPCTGKVLVYEMPIDGLHVISRLSLSLPVGGWGVNCQCVCVGAMRCRCCAVLCCVEVAFDVHLVLSCCSPIPSARA